MQANEQAQSKIEILGPSLTSLAVHTLWQTKTGRELLQVVNQTGASIPPDAYIKVASENNLRDAAFVLASYWSGELARTNSRFDYLLQMPGKIERELIFLISDNTPDIVDVKRPAMESLKDFMRGLRRSQTHNR